MMRQILVRLPPLSRRQWLVATALVLVLVLALLALLLRPGIASLAEVRAQRAQAEQAVQAGHLLGQLHRELEAALASHTIQEAVLLGGLSEQQRFVKLLGQINGIGERHQVLLDRVTPAPVRRLPLLDELPLDVELTGSYQQVSAMLLEMARGLPQACVSAFQIERTETGTQVQMKARISVYLEREKLK